MVSIKYIYELAKIKKELDPDLNKKDLMGIVKMIISTANTMGIEVIEDQDPPDAVDAKII